MPHKTKRVPFAEEMPDTGKNAEGVSDDRAEDNTCHSHKLCKNDGAHNVPPDLEDVADIVAEFVSVAVNHLFEIENDDRQQSIDRSEHVVFQRLSTDLSGNAVDVEINVLDQEDNECG